MQGQLGQSPQKYGSLMKVTTVELPDDGVSVSFVGRGQAVIVTGDEVEVRVSKAPAAKTPLSKLTKHPEVDLDGVLNRLQKLKPKKRDTAINSIKAMFQFTGPIDDAAASNILDALQRSGSVTVDANDKLTFKEVK